MSTINFYLKQADKRGECPIMLIFQNKGQKFKYYTRLKISPAAWNGIRVKTNYTGYSEINSILDDLENILKALLREALFNKKEYPVQTLKKKFLLKLGSLTHSDDFFSVYNKFI